MKRTDRIRAVGAALAATIAVWAAPAMGAEPLTIADIAPRNSALVVGVDDFAAMRAAFDRTGMRAIMDEPSVKAWFEETTREVAERLTQMLESIDADMDDLSMPSGAAGFAVWAAEQAEPEDPPFGFIAMGDFGEGAEQIHATLLAAFEKGEEKDQLTMKREEFAGAEIFTLTQITPVVDEVPEEEDEGDEWEDWEGWEDDPAAPPDIETVYYARVGPRLLVTSAMRDLENAIDRIGGKALEGVRESESFHAARTQVGTHDGYMVLLTGPLFEAVAAEARKLQEQGIPGFNVLPILDALGIVEIEAVSMGLKFDTDDGMLESRYAMLAPKFRGLLTLLDVPPASFEPPAFVPADAATYSLFQFKLSGLMEVLQSVVQGLPAEQAQQAGMMLPMVQGFLGPMLDAMGSEIHMSQSYAQPFSATSQQTLVAIKAKDAEALRGAMSQSAAQMGLVSRDFQGTQLWSVAPDSQVAMMGAPDVALAIGYGHMFTGPEAVVENALRLAAQGGKEGAVSLANEERFRNAMRALPARGFSFSYMNIDRTIAYFKWFLDNYDQVMKEQMEALVGDIEDPEIRKMMAENQPQKPEWMDNLPNLDIIARHMGDSVTEFQRTDQGMKGRTVWLRPN